MEYRVGFEDKTIIFTHRLPQAGCVVLPSGEAVSRAKVLKKLRNCNSLSVVSDDPAGAFAFFRAQFRVVEACGGVVENPSGEVLMILRAGRWDLPKGHREQGESLRQCALREVEEECGVAGLDITGELPATRHIYKYRGRWTLKECRWFGMACKGRPALRPQAEEGIEQAVWSSDPEELARESFANIRWTLAARSARGERRR